MACAALICYSLFLTILGVASSVSWLVITFLFFGISGNLLNISINTQALMVQNNYGRVIMASFHGLWSLAGFCGAALGAFMLWLKTGIEIHFVTITVTVIILLLVSFNFLS